MCAHNVVDEGINHLDEAIRLLLLADQSHIPALYRADQETKYAVIDRIVILLSHLPEDMQADLEKSLSDSS